MKLSHIVPLHFNIAAGLVFCAAVLTAGWGFGETYNDGGTHNVNTAMTGDSVTVSNGSTLNWTYNGAAYPLTDKPLRVEGGSTFYFNQNKEVLGNTSAVFTGAGTVGTLDYYTANNKGLTVEDGAVLNIYNKGNNGYGALLLNGGFLKTTTGTATINFYGTNNTTYTYGSLRNNAYPIEVGTGATLTVNGGLYNTYNAADQSHNLTKKGAGTLIVQNGMIGASHSNGATEFSASTFIVQAGKVQLANQGSIYTGATIELGSGTTFTIDANAANSSNVTFTGAGTVNLNGAHLKGTPTIKEGATLNVSCAQGLADASLNLTNATVTAKASDALYHQKGTSNIANSTINAEQYTTLDTKLLLTGTNTITSTSVNGNANYGSFLMNGGWVNDEVVNVVSGTTTITTPADSKGIRMRGSHTGFDVADGAKLIVNSNITYDTGNGENDNGVSTGIYKVGKGTMTLARGTIGSRNNEALVGNVMVKQGTLELTGESKIFSGSTVTVDEGATLNFNSTNNADHPTKATYNVAGTIRLGSMRNVSNNASNIQGTINAEGNSALVDFAINDPLGYYLGAGSTTTVTAISLKDGATMTNSIVRTTANDGAAQVTVPSAITLEGGKITSYSIGRQVNDYGSYLLCKPITVTGEGKTSTIDSYMFQVRNDSKKVTIEPGATLEICSRVSTQPNVANYIWEISGGGTFRPIIQTREIQTEGATTQSYKQEFTLLTSASTLDLKDVALDLTELDSPITTSGNEWKLLTSTPVDNLGLITSAGTITATEDSRIQVNLTVEDGELLGQTLQANNFNVNGSALELFLDEDVDWESNADLLNGYKLFNTDSWGSFSSLTVHGDLAGLGLNAAGNALSLATSGVPEPATWVLLLMGLGVLYGVKRRR